mgnify:CR=1 FL=1
MKIKKPITNHLADFLNYRSKNLGYDDSINPSLCWDFYSNKVGAEWIDEEAFCIGVYPYMGGHAFGFFELKSNDKALQLKQWKSVKKKYSGQFYGPINGSSFLPYKFISKSDQSPIFEGEWNSTTETVEFMRSMNPEKIIKYKSAYRTSFDGVIEVSQPFLTRWVNKGFNLQTIELDSVDSILNLHHLVHDIFCTNWGYESMNQNQFSSWINSMTKRKNGSPLLYWVKIREKNVGFAYLFEMPDKTIIFKTLGIISEYQEQGLGNALAGELHSIAKKREAKKCIYAMVQLDNRVNRMPDPDISIMREYESYIF